MTRDPIHKKVRGIKEQQQHEVEALDRSAENRLLRALESASALHRYIVLFLLHTGLRNSEFARLEMRDIELGEKKQTVSDLLNNLPHALAIRSGMAYVREGTRNTA
jgi:integrase